MGPRPFAPQGSRTRLAYATALAMLVLGSGCDNGYQIQPLTQGGTGVVVSLDAGGRSDGSRDLPVASGVGGQGGGSPSGAGGTGSGAGAGGSVGAGGSAGAEGGAGGSQPPDDPCTACEKAKCSHPSGQTSPTDEYAIVTGAYEVCFVGTGWPSSTASEANYCGGVLMDQTGTTAVDGPAQGTAKTVLCQNLLRCVHQTNCTGGEDVDNQSGCYCGDTADGGVITLQTCEAPGFVPMGQCATQIAAALEVNVFSNSVGYFGNECLANGAAFALYDFCDANCCEQECLGMSPSGDEDPGFCNAPGAGGTTGSGGATGSGGTTGAGGATGTGGATGAGGSAGSGGTSAGGQAGSGGGAGGALGGSSGSGGTFLPLSNVDFDSNVAGWTPSAGATLSFSSQDAAGSAQSGSIDILVSDDEQPLSTQESAWQCATVTGGATYQVSVEVLIPGQNYSQGGIGLWFYVSGDCSGSIAGVYASPASTTTSGWQKVAGSVQVPAGVHSAAVRLSVSKPFGQPTAEALFDDVVVSQM